LHVSCWTNTWRYSQCAHIQTGLQSDYTWRSFHLYTTDACLTIMCWQIFVNNQSWIRLDLSYSPISVFTFSHFRTHWWCYLSKNLYFYPPSPKWHSNKKAIKTSNLNLCKIWGSHGSEHIIIFRDVAHYILIEMYRHSKRSQSQFSVKEFYILKMKASCCSETSSNFCQAIWRHIPQEVVFSINVFGLTIRRHVDMKTSEPSFSQCSLLAFYMDCVSDVVVPTSARQHSLNSHCGERNLSKISKHPK
jgi:hypothetical protein